MDTAKFIKDMLASIDTRANSWQSLSASAILRRHSGDTSGAIADMLKAIALLKPNPVLVKELAMNLNYLADLYIVAGDDERAEAALHDSNEISHPRFLHLVTANLWILAGIKHRQGKQEEAIALAQESRTICEQIGHTYGVREADELLEQIRMDSKSLKPMGPAC
jgi:tetratricopeptide (TPR) repeat protein